MHGADERRYICPQTPIGSCVVNAAIFLRSTSMFLEKRKRSRVRIRFLSRYVMECSDGLRAPGQ